MEQMLLIFETIRCHLFNLGELREKKGTTFNSHGSGATTPHGSAWTLKSKVPKTQDWYII